jgi:hypothetical protein
MRYVRKHRFVALLSSVIVLTLTLGVSYVANGTLMVSSSKGDHEVQVASRGKVALCYVPNQKGGGSY